jgi:hypothetical protein
LQRTKEKLGEWPRTENYNWREATDEQIGWDELFTMEYANAIGEKIVAIEDQDRKLSELEDHLASEAAQAYGNDDSKPRSEK